MISQRKGGIRKFKKGDWIEFRTGGRNCTGKIFIVNDHDNSYDVDTFLDGGRILVKHLPGAEIITGNMVLYQWTADGEPELCRKESGWIQEGTCYHCGQLLSGDCILLTAAETGDVYPLHAACCRISATPLKQTVGGCFSPSAKRS